MTGLRLFTAVVAALLALGEIARWWGDPRFVPLAFDELIISAALLAAACGTPRFGAGPLAAAWAAFCGFTLSLLVPTLDHLIHGPPKESARFYGVILALMLAVGLWATGRALALRRRSAPGR